MKLIIPILLLFVGQLYSQSNNLSGEYFYKSTHYYESINLMQNGTFEYFVKTEFLRNNIIGNWQIRDDSILVLDSYPQKKKMLVWENYKKFKKNVVYVRNSNNEYIHYELHLLTSSNDTIVYKNQFKQSTIKEHFVAFYIIDTKGLYSPKYIVQGSNSNFFSVLFETQRVFENEFWKINNTGITPLGLDNQYSNYRLKKK